MLKAIIVWIKAHVITTTIISVVVVGAVLTPIILFNTSNKSESTMEENNNAKEPDSILEEEKLNADGCKQGYFLNYYGICQDEDAYKPQECPQGQEWLPNLAVTKENADGTVTEDYEATYGIDGLPKGGCADTYETYCKKLAENPNAVPCGNSKYDKEEQESFSKRGLCERGFFWNSEINGCYDMRDWHRSIYEKRVLGKE